MFQWSFNTGGGVSPRTGLQQTLTEGSLSWRQWREFLKTWMLKEGRIFFFPKRKGGRSGQEGEGAWEDVSLPRTIQVVGRYLSLRRGQQSMGPRSRLLLKPVCFAGSPSGSLPNPGCEPTSRQKRSASCFFLREGRLFHHQSLEGRLNPNIHSGKWEARVPEGP